MLNIVHIKTPCLIVGMVLFLQGCFASSARRQFNHDVKDILTQASANYEPCNITCGKLKTALERYRMKSGGVRK